jgi:tripartite-type tricarboxylate transporter receptor subunit TctC
MNLGRHGARFGRAALICLGASVLFVPVAARAQTYPSRPVTLVVPYPPGGSTDVAGRTVAAEMGKLLKQTVVVEDRSGVVGALGIGSVAKAAPDGYTLGVSGVSPSVIMELVGAPISYRPGSDLAIVGLIGLIGQIELVFVARKDFPANTIGDLVKLAKAQPGTINYASAGQSGNIHVYWEYLCDLAGIRMTHIPYKGDAPTLLDLMGGTVDVGLLSVPSALEQIKAGKIKALGLAGHKKLDELPSAPLVSESGLPGYDVAVWNVLVGPAALPRDVLRQLNAALNESLRQPELQKRFASLGMSMQGGSPAEAQSHVEAERARWKQVVAKAGIKYAP